MLIEVKIGRLDHDEAQANPLNYTPYDGHNYFQLKYSEPVDIGGPLGPLWLDSPGQDTNDNGLVTVDPPIASTRRAESNVAPGGLGGYIHDNGGSGTVSVAGYFDYPGSFTGGSIDGTAPTSSLFRSNNGDAAINTDGDHGVMIVVKGHSDVANLVERYWWGYIESASYPAGQPVTVPSVGNKLDTRDLSGAQNPVFDQDDPRYDDGANHNEPVIAEDPLSPVVGPGPVYWDIDPPELANFAPYANPTRYSELAVFDDGLGDPRFIDRVELHFHDNPAYRATLPWDSIADHPDIDVENGLRDYQIVDAMNSGALRLDFEGESAPEQMINYLDVATPFSTTVDNEFFNPLLPPITDEDDTYVGFQIDDGVRSFPVEASLSMNLVASHAQTSALDVIADLAGNRLKGFSGGISIERIPPNIAATLTIAETNRVYIRFSEYVNAQNGQNLATVADPSTIFEVVNELGDPTGLPTVTGITPLQDRFFAFGAPDVYSVLDAFLTLSGNIDQTGIVRYRIRPVAAGRIEDEFTTPISAFEENRISDVAMGAVIPTAAWSDIQREAGDLVYGDEFAGLISAAEFDGSAPMVSGRDITIQTQIADPVNQTLPVELYFDMAVPNAYLTPPTAPETPNRYWLPVSSPIIDDPDTPDTEVLRANTEARRLVPDVISGQFREYVVPGTDSEMSDSDNLQFVYTIAGIPAARYTDINDPRTVIPYEIDLRRFIEQRDGVTILNNVIYPEAGDQTVLVLELERASTVTMNVLSLDGQLVKVLQRGRMNEGTQRVAWDGTNQNGDIVATGLYFIRVVASGVDQIRKVLVAK